MPRKKTTRNANGSGTIYKRSDGRYEGKALIGYNPATGKPIRKSVYGKTQQEVRRKITEITSELDKGTYKEPSKLLLSEWLDIWLKDYMTGLKPLTVKSYNATTANHIKPNLGRVPLSSLTTHQIQRFINTLAKEYSPKTVKNIHGVLHQALEQAVIINYLPSNPADNIKLPKYTKKDIKPLDKAEIPLFLEAIKGDRYESLFLVDLFTGMRESEIIGLTWDHVDFDTGTINICRQWQKLKGGCRFVTLKSDKTRTITPGRFVMDLLRKEKVKQAENKLKAGSAWNNPHNFVFTNEVGDFIRHATLWARYKKIVTSIGLPELRFHDLRHTFAVVSLQAGNNVKVVQESLGHYSAAFTLDTYAHVTKTLQQESADRIDAFINSL